jgi:hypothetical protein
MTITCQACDYKQNPDDSEFCEMCGAELLELPISEKPKPVIPQPAPPPPPLLPAPAPPAMTITCQVCNYEQNPDDSEFCQACGVELELPAAPPPSPLGLLAGVLPPSAISLAPPPSPLGLLAGVLLLVLGVVLAGVLLLVLGVGIFLNKMILVTVVICLVPTLAYWLTQKRGRVARVAVETILFVLLILASSLWILGTSILGIWIGYLSVLIFLIEAGSNFVEWYTIKTLKRISRSVLFESIRTQSEAFEKMFREEQILYITVPVGLILGTIIASILRQSPKQVIVLCLQIVFALSSLVLIFFLIKSFIIMSKPLFKTEQVLEPTIARDHGEESESWISWLKNIFREKVLRLEVPPLGRNIHDQQNYDITLACLSRDLRKIYLYDAIHNVTLVVAFVAFLFSLSDITIDKKWLIMGLIGMVFIFNQLPYAIGQSLLRKEITDRYEGERREEMQEKFKKYIPLWPRFEFLASIFTPSTAGGLLILLFDNFVKEALK